MEGGREGRQHRIRQRRQGHTDIRGSRVTEALNSRGCFLAQAGQLRLCSGTGWRVHPPLRTLPVAPEDLANYWHLRVLFQATHVTPAHVSLVRGSRTAQPVLSGMGKNTSGGIREQHL